MPLFSLRRNPNFQFLQHVLPPLIQSLFSSSLHSFFLCGQWCYSLSVPSESRFSGFWWTFQCLSEVALFSYPDTQGFFYHLMICSRNPPKIYDLAAILKYWHSLDVGGLARQQIRVSGMLYYSIAGAVRCRERSRVVNSGGVGFLLTAPHSEARIYP